MLDSIRKLTDIQLKSATLELAVGERKLTVQVISHLAEVDRRKLYLKWGFSSLFDYLVNELKYSESAAFRRIQAARAMNKTPEIKSALETGDVKLSQVALVQTAIRREERATGRTLSMAQRSDLFIELKNKTAVQTETILNRTFESNARAALLADSCQEQYLGDGSVQIQLRLPSEIFAQLKRIKELYSHIDPNADWIKILELMTLDVLKKRDPLAQKNLRPTAASAAKPPASVAQSVCRKPIPTKVRRAVLQRSQGKCEFKSKEGRVCGSSVFVQIDHIQAVSNGGGNEIQNLRALCGPHNRYVYKERESAISNICDLGNLEGAE